MCDRDPATFPSLQAAKVLNQIFYFGELKLGFPDFLWTFFAVDLQNVNITLRILHRPVEENLPKLYQILGVDYDERVLPSIANEVLKAVVVSFFWDRH
jgi:hypothetical protein